MSKFGLAEATNHMWLFFSSQVDLVERLRVKVIQEEGEVWAANIPLLYAISDSSETLIVLSQKGKLRDCFIIGRTIFETVVNALFIIAQGEEAAKKARRHAYQKSFRDLDRTLEINHESISIHWTGKDSLTKEPELDEALQEFTSKAGHEITSWTPENVKERIEIIANKYGKEVSRRLQFGLLSIYRHASEIAHGTVFGALYVLGMTSPGVPKKPAELESQQRGQLSMVLLMIGLCLSALIMVFEREIGDSELTSESKKILEKLKEEPWLNDSIAGF